MKTFLINDVGDIKQFFGNVHELYPFEWHPDDDFKDFVDEANNRTFSDKEAEYYNEIMVQCFQFCDDNDLDIYDVAAEVQTDIWKKRGIGLHQ